MNTIATMWQILRASLVLVDSWLLEIFFRYFDIFPLRKIFKMVRRAKSYPSEKLSPKPHFLLRHFLTFSIIARIIYALVCQTCYIRYLIKYILQNSKLEKETYLFFSSSFNTVIYFRYVRPHQGRIRFVILCCAVQCSVQKNQPMLKCYFL